MANQPDQGPDPVVNSDRGSGTTPPERGPESGSVVGRPATEKPKTAFHEPAETADDERASLDKGEALSHGGSFDGIAPPGEQSPGG